MKSPIDSKRRKAEAAGRAAEQQAADYLKARGWEILGSRVKTRSGEIDLIASKGRVTAFVEVKARATLDGALLAVTQRQAKRIISAANHWLAGNPDAMNNDCRFDIILISPYFSPEHLENAFGADL